MPKWNIQIQIEAKPNLVPSYDLLCGDVTFSKVIAKAKPKALFHPTTYFVGDRTIPKSRTKPGQAKAR